MPKNNMTFAGNGFKKLTATFSVWTLFLVFAGTITQAINFSQSIAWIEHWVISSITTALITAIIIVVWRRYRHDHFIFWPALAAALIAVAQISLVTVAIRLNHHPAAMAGHLFLAMLNLGVALFLTTAAHLPAKHLAKIGLSSQSHKFYFRSIVLTGVGFLLLLMTGAIVTGTGTGWACSDWPLCRGEIFPVDFSLGVAIALLHRFTVVIVAALVTAVILQTHRRYKQYASLLNWSTTLGCLFLAQIGVGGLHTLPNIPQLVISSIHLGLTAAVWGSLVVPATISYLTLETVLPLPENEEAESSPLPFPQKATTFFKLTKPWILVLLLTTTITAMFIAAKGLPPISLVLYTLLGGALSAGGAGVLNSYIDSDIDHLMSRTSRRATVTGLITPQETLLFGLTLSVLSFLVFAIFVNLLSAVLSAIGILYYVFFYTLYLKRTTIHNIVIGGAAGAIPPLVGWTAVTNTLDLGAFYLFAIIFFWTPPHTWALALLVKKDYAQARIPMLPVVAGEKETTYQIFLYTILLITLTLLPFSVKMLSWVYLIAAVTLGTFFIYLAWKLWQDYSKKTSKQLYKFSQLYLALLFLVMALDRSLF